MADINLSIKVVSADGSTRTVDLSQGGSLAVKAGDRLILFGSDADKATLVRNGEDLALMIDGQQFFILDGYYALAGDQAAEIITDPAVAATFLTAAEGGLPLLTTPPAETAGPAPAETGVPQVDLIQATAPTLPGDNASAKAWRSDDDINLDDPTYRPIEITYDVEDELIIEASVATPPTPTTPTTAAVNLPPYFTTVTVEVDDLGNVTTATPNANEPVDEYNFQQYEIVAAYQVMLPGPHPMDVTGDGAAGHPYYYLSGGSLPPTDVSETNGAIVGWGYIPFYELGYIGVADPENDPLTVAWADGITEYEIAAPGWQVWVSASLGTDLGELEGESALYLVVQTDAAGDPIWENVFEVYSGVWDPAFPESFAPGFYDYDGVDGIAALYGISDHFSTIITVADPYHAPVEAQVNLDILDVNEAPEFQGGIEEGPYDYYQFNPWGPENLDPANAPDTAHDPDYEVYVGSVYALDPDYLDQLYGQVFYNFFDSINYSAEDPFNPGVADTAGWRPDSWEVYSLDGLLNINQETGDIWMDIDLMQSWLDGEVQAPQWFYGSEGYSSYLAAHDMVDRFGEITDGDGEVVYDNDRIFSDLWDLAYMWIEGDQAPVLYEIVDIYESMQTTTDTLIQEGGVWMIDQAEAIMSQGYYVLQADDPDGTDVNFALGDTGYGDTALFNIQEVGGEWRLVFNMDVADIDFETQSSFDVELVLNDGFLNFTEHVTVNLLNANETPWFENTGDVDALPEVASTGTNVAWFDINDFDVPEDFTRTLLADDGSGFNPNDYFEIVLEGGQWVVQIKSGVDLADLGDSVTFKVAVQDDGGETAGVNLADLFTVSFEVTAVDQSVDENFGHVPWAGMSGDYPTGHEELAGDGTAYGYLGDADYTYDGNFDDPANWSFTFEADGDTYSLGGADAAFFELTWDGGTNTYTLAFKPDVLAGTAAAKLDYEALGANTVLDVEVSSTVVGDAFYDLNVEVNNVNENPYDLGFDFGNNEHEGDHVALNESATSGSFVAQVTFKDEDDPLSTNDTYHYGFWDDADNDGVIDAGEFSATAAGGLFTINQITGQITLAAGANLDYELADSYELHVAVFDSSLNGGVGYGPLYGATSFNVDVTDTEREPDALSSTVDENAGHVPWGTMTGGEELPTGHDTTGVGVNEYGYPDGASYEYDGLYNGPAQWSFEFTSEGDKDDYDITGVNAGGYFSASDFELVNTGSGVAVQFANPGSVVLDYEGNAPNSFTLTIAGIDTAYDSSTAYPNDEINDVTYTINVDVNDVNETPYDLHFTGDLVSGNNDTVDTTEAHGDATVLADAEVYDEDGLSQDTYHWWFWVDGNDDGLVGADELYASILTDANGGDLLSIDSNDGEIWVSGVLDYEALGSDWLVVEGVGDDPDVKTIDLQVAVFDSSENGTIGYGPLHTTGTLTVNVSDVHDPHSNTVSVDEYASHVPWDEFDAAAGDEQLPNGHNELTTDYTTYSGGYLDPTDWYYDIVAGSVSDYDLTTGGSTFELFDNGGTVAVRFQDATGLDYEAGPTSYGFVVEGTTAGTNDESWDITVNVNNVNETPYDVDFIGANSQSVTGGEAEIDENLTGAFAQVTFGDEDDPMAADNYSTASTNDTYHYWFWVDGDGDHQVDAGEISATAMNGLFAINTATGEISVADTLDYEALTTGWTEVDGGSDPDYKWADLNVAVIDSSLDGSVDYGPLNDTATLTVNVSDQHDPHSETVSVDEYAGHVPWDEFDAATGDEQLPNGHNETSGDYTTYSGGYDDPTTWVYKLTTNGSASDYDLTTGDDVFDLVDTVDGWVGVRFELADALALNFESTLVPNTYNFVVEGTTAGTNDESWDITVNVNNVNETPYDVHFDPASGGPTVASDEVTVTENYDGNLAQVDFSDEDETGAINDTYHYWFWNDDGDGEVEAGEISDTAMNGLFSININTGLISTTGAIDYESLGAGWTEEDGDSSADFKWTELDVAVIDSGDGMVGYGPLNDTATLKVTVTDEGPTVDDPTNAFYDEEALAGGNHGESYPAAYPPPSLLANADMPDSEVDPTGTLNINWGSAGAHPTEALAIELVTTGLTTADGLAIIWDSSTNTAYDSDNNEVFRLDITNGDDYEYVQSQALFHASTPMEDDLVLSFNFTAKDATGDTADGSFTVTIDDDAPVAFDDAVTTTGNDLAPINLYFITDLSRSMEGDGLATAKESLNHLLDEYADLGVDVRVTLLTFSTGYSDEGTFDITGGGLQDAHDEVNSWVVDWYTNYTDVLDYAQTQLAADLLDPNLTGWSNIVYFLSDGDPNPDPGSTGDGEAPAGWQTFIDANGIEAIALGMGTGIDISSLYPVDNAGDTPIIVSDPNDLTAELSATVPAPISGDVLANDSFGADGPGGLVAFTYDGGAESATVAEGGSTTVTTAAGGTLTVHYDGTWEYNAPSGYAGEDGFTYTIEDADHDNVTAFQSIEVINDTPEILELTGGSVDEEGLAGGNIDDGYPGDLAGSAVTFNGAIDIDYGADGPHASTPLTLSASGASWDAGSQTLSALNGSWNLVVNNDNTYTFNLTGPQEHSTPGVEDDFTITVNVSAMDATGDEVNGSFTVTVDDDGPIANDDLVVSEGTNLAPINLYFITDLSYSMLGDRLATAKESLNHLLDEYADLGVDVRVTLLTFSTSFSDEGTFDITGGELQAAHDEVNSWDVILYTNYTDVLNYAQTQLANDLTDPSLDGWSNIVYFLSDGNPNPDPSSSVDGEAPDGWQDFIDANGIEAIALGMGGDVTIDYLVPVDNAGDTPIIVTDPDDLTAELINTLPAPISGDVLANDEMGADGFGELVSFTYTDEFGASQTVTNIDGTAVTTENGGELIVNSDGTWTYTPAANFDGNDSFTYTVTDGDGDPDTATQTIQIVDINPPVEAVLFQSASAGDSLGYAVSNLGDVNGDGLDDYIIGAPNGHAAYVVFGDADTKDFTNPVDLDALDGSNGFKIVGAGAGDLAGWSVANAGDVNGDGIMDILVGAPSADGSEAGPDVWTPGDFDYDFTDFLSSGATPDSDGDFVIANFMPDVNGNMITATVSAYQGTTEDRPVTWNSDNYFGVDGSSGPDDQIDGSNPDEHLIVEFGGANDYVYLTGLTVTSVDGGNSYNRDDGSAILHLAGGSTVVIDIDTGDTAIDFGTTYEVSWVEFETDGAYGDDYGVVGFSGGGEWTAGSAIPVDDGGSTYVIYGSADDFDAEIDLANLEGGDGSGFKIVGQDGESGFSVHGIGNYNGDAYSDMIIGAPSASGTGFLGAAYVVMGAASMPAVSTLDDLISSGQAIKLTPSADGEAGYSVGAADVDNDGDNEILIGSPLADLGAGDEHGTVHITNFDGSIDITLRGQNGDQAGWSVSGAGDIDGDGYEDVIIGAPGYDDGADVDAGAAYVVYGGYLQANTTATIDLESLVSSGDALKIVGASAGDKLGSSVSAAGDVNGDGIDDIIVGAPEADNSDNDIDAGEAVIIFGSDQGDLGGADSIIDVADLLDGDNGGADDGAGVVFEGADAGDNFGSSVSGAGDVNGDNNDTDEGGDDVLVGADGANGGDGEAYLLLGTEGLGDDQVLPVEEVAA